MVKTNTTLEDPAENGPGGEYQGEYRNVHLGAVHDTGLTCSNIPVVAQPDRGNDALGHGFS